MIQEWYEVWVDESIKIPYVLFLCPDPSNPEGMLIIDPKQNNQVIQRLPDYNTAVSWLTEDEYTRVDGRMEIE
ncbi:MAG: hypothetical protein ACYT04_60480 [Nostoc sp.]|uniref:hypothetical protein n=1 Tax=Nostoc sp. NOS(2021) TaxID=2815407 RepID=UPI0025DFEB3D|nr:hypothetical protein [Nostoc sp. NOS(2021)]MBN3897318.1 hypothetical protein [Nostoc sp. NOS(2021)]